MTDLLTPDICVIGAGSGGLSVAAAAAQFGESVVLVEKGEMGGDCLNTGCVPSKALIAAAKHAHAVREAAAFGVTAGPPATDFARVHAHVHGVIAAIAPHDSQERFEGLGCTVIRAAARFTGPDTVEAGGRTIRARRFVVATGSRAGVPPIPGLDAVPFLTNESVFDLTALPTRLVVIGAGPIGLELAQAHRRLGSEVVVLEAARAYGRDDPELAAIARRGIEADGVTIREGVKIASVAGTAGAVTVTLDGGETIAASHLLVAAGRVPNVDGLGLEAAGVTASRRGIAVDRGLRSSNPKVFAVGDVADVEAKGALQFTHVAGYHAGLVVRRLLFRLPAKENRDILPWVTYTDPELARVGLSEAEARERFGDRVKVLSQAFSGNDRAQAERATEGLLKVIVGPRGRVLGAGIVGRGAGELANLYAYAVANGATVQSFTRFVSPYPTLGDITKRVAYQYYAGGLTSPWPRRIIRFLKAFG